MIEITGSHERGNNITGWQDGRAQCRIWWKGTDGIPTPESIWTEYTEVATTERQALVSIGHIHAFANLRLVSAVLEPLGAIQACPRCDKPLELREAIPWCPRCERPVLRDELERAARVKRVIEGHQDVIDQAVSDGTLPG
jgi:hypothetical protein